MAIDWSLLQVGNPAGAFQAGLEHGRENARAQRAEGALSAYVRDPTNKGALFVLTQADPRTGLALMKDQREQERQQMIGTVAQAASSGDPAALAHLWTVAPELADRFQKAHDEHHKTSLDAFGQAAYDIALRPPAERPAVWDAYVDKLSATHPDVAQYKGQYSEQALNGVLADTGMTQKVIEARQPKYVVAPAGGGLVNSNPLSPGFNPGAAAPAQATGLPEGFTIDAPGGAAPQASAPFVTR